MMKHCMGGWTLALIMALSGANGVAADSAASSQHDPWLTFEGGDGPGAGKRVVLISGDEEYRSEEALPQLAKILSKRHGFTCTVLFAIDPETGQIQPNVNDNIPGLKALDDADVMVIATRFRNLPDEQMAHIDAYLKAGKPVLGMRTATHAFNIPEDRTYAHYSFNSGVEGWDGGFGRQVLGETWIAHHGQHKHESTRGVIAPGADKHPIVRGIDDGDIWGPTDVYEVRLPLPGDSTPLVLGQVVAREGEFDEGDIHFGMRPSDSKPVEGKNDPMMPIAWTKTYQLPGGKQGPVFTTTMGAATDLLSQGVRRMLVQAVYWCAGIESAIPEDGANVKIVGEFAPSPYGFHEDAYWEAKELSPQDFAK